MYRTVADFSKDWHMSSKGTLNVLKAIPDEKMGQSIVVGHNTLGWLAWHLVGVAGAFGQFAGLQIPAPGPEMAMPNNMADIIESYEMVIEAYKKEIVGLSDEQLAEDVPAFGGSMPRGALFRVLIDHQTHHRGQMTVLLRQAGLIVPPVMGPTAEMS
ncbi:DinB family protein [Metasolibacillus meyeri]|uniref:DinB family protein n=1 Tax=Metasolibacillus meyeri TaxID=1071052 RepID=A0AAW9NN77_9BACL|nr:DinB family protein [Metasolibacillus meyeri]MEC1177936.1 DinB family protein [Metasolibacillus meyeri]